MRRFFVRGQNLFPESNKAYIDGEDVHHISAVLRLKPGSGLILLDGLGKEYQARIISITPERVEVSLENTWEAAGEPPIEVNLVQGLPKGDKMELIIQKCTELGVRNIFPVETSRAVVKLNENKKAQKLRRWQRVAQEAAKQCRRAVVPEIFLPCGFDEALRRLGNDTFLLMPWEEEHTAGIKEVLSGTKPAGKITILIGPEGGWSKDEVQKAKSIGAVTVHLGPRILRAETAGMTALALVLYAWGDLGG